MALKNLSESVKKNKFIIFTFAVSVWTSFSLCFLFFDFDSASQLILLLAVGLFFIYKPILNKINEIKNVPVKILSFFTAMVLTITLTMIGGVEKTFDEFLSSGTNMLIFYVSVLGVAVFLGSLIVFTVDYLSTVDFKRFESDATPKTFFLIWGGMFLVWGIMYCCYYPGIITADSISQLYIANGISSWSNHHPVLHTLLISCLMKLGNQKPLVYMLFQMLAMSAIYSYCCYYMRKNNVYKGLWYATVCYFIGHPIHSYSSFTMVKDTLFSGFVLLMTICFYEIVSTKGECVKKFGFVFALLLCALLVMLFRNNGFVLVVLSAVVYPFFIRKNRIKVCTILFSAVIIYFLCTGFLYPALKIEQPSMAESLAIPLQQIARVIYEQKDLPKDITEYINTIIPKNDLINNYSPTTIDTLKFHDSFDISVISSDVVKFIKTWFAILLKYPMIYIEAYLMQTECLWNLCARAGLIENFYDSSYFTNLRMTPLFEPISGLIRSIVNVSQFSSFAFFTTPFWNVSGCYLVVWISFLVSLLKKKKSDLIVMLPVIGVWISLALAIPAALVGRYAYSVFACLPLILARVFSNRKKIE